MKIESQTQYNSSRSEVKQKVCRAERESNKFREMKKLCSVSCKNKSLQIAGSIATICYERKSLNSL